MDSVAQMHKDGLTGCYSRYALEYDLTIDLHTLSRKSQRYRQSFLFVDVENMQRYLDFHGYGPADAALIELGRRLRLHYPTLGEYRYGGDKFVVVGADVFHLGISEKLPVAIKHAIVRADIGVVDGRHHRAASWLLLHIHEGIVKASIRGALIVCQDRTDA